MKIKKVEIKNFKAFKEIKFDCGEKSVLIYGENGSGKSSLCSALDVFFFWEKIESKISGGAPILQAESATSNYVDDLKIDKGQDIQIKINDRDYTDPNRKDNNTEIYFIGHQDVTAIDSIILDEILNCRSFSNINKDDFRQNHAKKLFDTINKILKERFIEDVTIESNDGNQIGVKDDAHNIELKVDNLSSYFNEANLHLIKILLYLEIIKEMSNAGKDRIIVLDDFITSLDAANRALIVSYINETFTDFQLIILTHNASFFNLIKFRIGNDANNKWNFFNIIETGVERTIEGITLKNASKIKQEYNNHRINKEVAGNEARKAFERCMQEYAKLLHLGAIEETKNLIELIRNNSKSILFKAEKTRNKPQYKVKTNADFLKELDGIIHNTGLSDTQKSISIKKEYARYSGSTEMSDLANEVSELRFLQKLTLHPSSHGGRGGIPSTTRKELNKSLDLIIHLEKQLSKLQGGDITTI